MVVEQRMVAEAPLFLHNFAAEQTGGVLGRAAEIPLDAPFPLQRCFEFRLAVLHPAFLQI
jgi:hypothetical protein